MTAGWRDARTAGRGASGEVLLMDSETLDELGVAPGVIKEKRHHPGTQGGVWRSPCRARPARCMDDIRPGLQAALRHRGACSAALLEGGLIRRGDAIEMMELAQATAPERGKE